MSKWNKFLEIIRRRVEELSNAEFANDRVEWIRKIINLVENLGGEVKPIPRREDRLNV